MSINLPVFFLTNYLSINNLKCNWKPEASGISFLSVLFKIRDMLASYRARHSHFQNWISYRAEVVLECHRTSCKICSQIYLAQVLCLMGMVLLQQLSPVAQLESRSVLAVSLTMGSGKESNTLLKWECVTVCLEEYSSLKLSELMVNIYWVCLKSASVRSNTMH